MLASKLKCNYESVELGLSWFGRVTDLSLVALPSFFV